MKKICVVLLCSCTQFLIASTEKIDLQTRLHWINPESLELAISDLSKQKGYDVDMAKKELSYIKDNLNGVLKQMEGPDSLVAMDEARILLDKQRKILLANPLLDMDKIVVTRFVLGDDARIATTNAMCMPMSNYMGLIDVPSSGYNAEL